MDRGGTISSDNDLQRYSPFSFSRLLAHGKRMNVPDDTKPQEVASGRGVPVRAGDMTPLIKEVAHGKEMQA